MIQVSTCGILKGGRLSAEQFIESNLVHFILLLHPGQDEMADIDHEGHGGHESPEDHDHDEGLVFATRPVSLLVFATPPTFLTNPLVSGNLSSTFASLLPSTGRFGRLIFSFSLQLVFGLPRN